MPIQIKVTCPSCDGYWFGRRAEHCTVCHKTFTTTSAADAHRAGRHGIDRHCLPPERIADGRRAPHGLKWNPKLQAWGWPSSEVPLTAGRVGQERGSQPLPGTKYQGEVSEDQMGGL